MARLPDRSDFPGAERKLLALSKPGRTAGATTKLPTREDLGARPTPRSSRGVVSFRADIAQEAEVRGIAQVGKATQEAFRGFEKVLDGFGERAEK